ncbi:MAG: flagellar motor switch protein FliG [Kiritimatiellia bacterium]
MAQPAKSAAIRVADLTGVQRAAVLVMYLDSEVAKKLLEHFSLDELEEIGIAMADVQEVTVEVIEEVIANFIRDLYAVYLVPKTGKEFALDVLPTLIDDARRDQVMSRLRRHISTEFQEYISGRPPATVATLVLDEHPQTQAIALLLMGPDNAALVLSYMDEEDQYDLSLRMARIERIPGELADDVEYSIRDALEERGTGMWSIEGVDTTAQMLGRLHSDFQQPILERIAGTDYELSELLKRRMLLFKDLIRLDNKAMQAILKVVERQTLLYALRGADQPMLDLFLGNMSSRAAEDLKDEIEIMAPISRSEVETAQEEIVQAALQLNEEGTIRLPMGGGDDDLV